MTEEEKTKAIEELELADLERDQAILTLLSIPARMKLHNRIKQRIKDAIVEH
jgi:hypothetical protein